ncbi:MFS transporter [Streptomyces virginiae]|uniref:MFS transporter n=1 Tax=Streptomyces virginiae TaxID=1961 RepID=UPI0036B21D5C
MYATPPDRQSAAPAATATATLAALAAAQFAVTLSTSIVNVALPAVRDGVGLSDAGMSWVVNAYGLAFGALLLLGGRAADLLGRRRVLTSGLALFAVAAVAAGLASAPWMLVTARTAQGVGAAAIAPAALSLVMRLHPPGPARARALGVWGAVSGAGGAAGVLLGGILTEGPGWPWVFHASGIGAAVVLAATVRLVPADRRRTPDPAHGSTWSDPSPSPPAWSRSCTGSRPRAAPAGPTPSSSAPSARRPSCWPSSYGSNGAAPPRCCRRGS